MAPFLLKTQGEAMSALSQNEAVSNEKLVYIFDSGIKLPLSFLFFPARLSNDLVELATRWRACETSFSLLRSQDGNLFV